MLERTAGCLESGSLRRLLPASKQSLQSRRKLHSGFWNHAAAGIESSPFWAALIRAANPADIQGGLETVQTSLTSHGTIVLDFLYPAGTINFLRQKYSTWAFDRQDKKWATGGFARVGQRHFTSSSTEQQKKDLSPGTPASSEELGKSDDGDSPLVYEVLGLTTSYDYEEAWRKYMLLDGDAQWRIRKSLSRYMSQSHRIIDAERTVELFEGLESQRDPTSYRCAIRSYLTLRNLADAMQIYEEALQKFQIPIGSEEILSYLASNSQWSRAHSLWEKVVWFLEMRPKCSYNMFSVLDSHQNIVSEAGDLITHVNRRISSSPIGLADQASLVQFATIVVHRALLSSKGFDASQFLTLIQTLHSWKTATPVIYEDSINLLLSLRQAKLAIECYRYARAEDVELTANTLHALLETFCERHSVIGMQQILEDFFRVYGKPTLDAYKLCLREFAAQGDADTVHALFEQFASRCEADGHGHEVLQDGLISILHVHSRRGEVQEVINWFGKLKEQYGFTPTLICWNILINAFGRVHDIKSAYECFESLLATPDMKPNHYTFGTMMGISIEAGDLENVMELFMLAEELRVQITAAMVDCLVLGYCQQGDIKEAEKICDDALTMDLRGSRTRMWNYILVAYAMRQDLDEVNRVLRRMAGLNITYNSFTYAALMQALAVAKQPSRAQEIMNDVMPLAGITPTSFHFAIVMGGYLANGENEKAIRLHNRMDLRNIPQTPSSNLLLLKNSIALDEILLRDGTTEELGVRAVQKFRELTTDMDPQDIVGVPRKGAQHSPLDITYPAMFYSFILYVLAKLGSHTEVARIYEEYLSILPQREGQTHSLSALSALMTAKLGERDHSAVADIWEMALSQSKEVYRPRAVTIRMMDESSGSTVDKVNDVENSIQEPPAENPSMETCVDPATEHTHMARINFARQLELSAHLSIYMQSLFLQNKVEQMIQAVDAFIADGFDLSNKNWNDYIMFLARRYKHKLAFRLCERRLMDGWRGWARIRWALPVRNRLDGHDRRWKKQPRNLRPLYHTLLYLARSYLELQAMAAESRMTEMILDDIVRDAPRVIRAIETMQRTDDELERHVLKGL